MEDERDKRAREIAAHLDSMGTEGLMTEQEIGEFQELIKLFEQKYLETFMQEHPDFPSRAAVWFSHLYDHGPFPRDVTEPEQITIPCTLKEFQLWEFSTAVALAGFGCSHRMIGAFLKRDKTTIGKYLDPIEAVIMAPLEPAEKEERVVEVTGEICDKIRIRTARETAKL